MVEITGASTRTIKALEGKGARAVKLATSKHAVTFKKGETLPQAEVKTNPVHKKVTEGPPIKDLQEAARRKGIKNFRILHKDELIKVLDSKTTQEEINKIIVAAVKRWKSGWGSREKEKK